MKKLIKIINSKILNPKKVPFEQKKSEPQSETKIQKKFLNFMFRKDKLNQNITFRSFQNYQQYTGNSLLATSNFQGTEFVIKKQADSIYGIKQQDQDKQQKAHQNSIEKLFDDTAMPPQIQLRFQELIKGINSILRDLYAHKKKLVDQKPFEWNISLTLWILVVVVVGLIFFSFNTTMRTQGPEKTQKENFFTYIFCAFVLTLISVGFINVLYAILKPYNSFNFDYEVIQKVTKKLMEQNQYFFHNKNYTLVCDIQMTWILLRPKGLNSRRMQIQENE